MTEPTTAICFVCLGNICRSPTAEGLMLHHVARAGLAHRFSIDSAGTADYHVGSRPDARTLATAQRRGVSLPSLARQFVAADFLRFDYVIAMDRSNLANLRALLPSAEQAAKLHLLRSFEERPTSLDVPDPYYGGAAGFDEVFDICDAACAGFLRWLDARHALGQSPSKLGSGGGKLGFEKK